MLCFNHHYQTRKCSRIIYVTTWHMLRINLYKNILWFGLYEVLHKLCTLVKIIHQQHGIKGI